MRHYLLFIFLFIINIVFGQSTSKNELLAKQDSIYKSNIKKTKIYGVYIPSNIDEAMIELDRLSTEDARSKLIGVDENMIASKLHYGLGRWMQYNWNFDEGSRFSHYLRGLGVAYPEDMVEFMLITYCRHVNKKDFEIEKRALVYKEKRQKEREERLKKGTVISETVVKKGG